MARLRIVLVLLGLASAGLLTLSLAQDLLIAADVLHWRRHILDVAEENTAFAFLSAFNLMAAGGLMAAIGRRARRLGLPRSTAWFVLAGLFVLLGIDEALAIHEPLLTDTGIGLAKAATGVPLRNSWWIPLVPVLILGLLWVWPLLRTLPRRTMTGAVLCGAAFVGGAIGVETMANLFCGVKQYLGGPDVPLQCRLGMTVEEALEGLSVIAFLFVLADYYRGLSPRSLNPTPPRPPAAG